MCRMGLGQGWLSALLVTEGQAGEHRHREAESGHTSTPEEQSHKLCSIHPAEHSEGAGGRGGPRTRCRLDAEPHCSVRGEESCLTRPELPSHRAPPPGCPLSLPPTIPTSSCSPPTPQVPGSSKPRCLGRSPTRTPTLQRTPSPSPPSLHPVSLETAARAPVARRTG